MDAIKKILLWSLIVVCAIIVNAGSNEYVRICAFAYLLIVVMALLYLAIRYLFPHSAPSDHAQHSDHTTPSGAPPAPPSGVPPSDGPGPVSPLRRSGSRRRHPESRCSPLPYDVREKSPIPLPTGKPLQGKSFSLSGSMLFKRDNMIALLTYFGGEYHRTPRRGTDYLVTTEDDTDKVRQAEQNGVILLSPDQLFTLMGTDRDELTRLMSSGDFLAALGVAMKPQRERAELHSYQRLADSYLRDIRTALCDLREITLPHPIQVVTRHEDGSLELYDVERLQRTERGEAILLATDGEAVYLQDVIAQSIIELRKLLCI